MIYCLMMCWIEKKVSSSRSLNCLFFINIIATGGDSSNKGCFGRKTNLFREFGDFAGNRETW